MNKSRGVKLSNGKVAMVDATDYDLVSKFKWHGTDKGYASRSIKKGNKRTSITMHRFLMNPPDDMYVDHIDGNKLNNRRSNLRICTHNDNCRNRKLTVNCTSTFKGVNWHKKSGKWQARVKFERKIYHLGLYDNEMDAAHAYNLFAVEKFGEYALLNPIPEGWVITTKNISKHDIQKSMGKRIVGASSQYKGVSKKGDKWIARIKLEGKLKYIGTYKTEKEAGLAYNARAKEAWGDMAYQNVINDVEDGATR